MFVKNRYKLRINNRFVVMRIKFIKANELRPQAKATAHQTGKLGFSSECEEYMGIKEGMGLSIGVNEEDDSDLNLYALVQDKPEEGSFKILKTGDYFYINAKLLFQELDIDFKNKRVIFDIKKTELDDLSIFKFHRREISKKINNKQSQENDLPTEN